MKEPRETSTSVQILSMIFFTGFAIPVSIVAIVHFWPAGIALAAYFAHLWGRIHLIGESRNVSEALDTVKPHFEAKGSGNSSFDAYRDELLNRLEREQVDFDGFLDRLRDAKDKNEFDRFMDDRAAAAKPTNDA